MEALPGISAAHHGTIVPFADFGVLDRFCLDALRCEAMAWPKPGLVTPADPGSHLDMDIGTFLASIKALEGTFTQLAHAAVSGHDLPALQAIGRAAEQRMLMATGGINTHRGAIYNLGFLVVASVRRRIDPSLAGFTCGEVVARLWGPHIKASRGNAPESHGNYAYRRFAAGGARDEAGAGFPMVYRVGIPTLNRLLRAGQNRETALIGTLMALVERVDDTNLFWRGGEAGVIYAQDSARRFNAAGGVEQAGWVKQLVAMHREFVFRNLSPGGSADLAAATLVAYHLDRAGRMP